MRPVQHSSLWLPILLGVALLAGCRREPGERALDNGLRALRRGQLDKAVSLLTLAIRERPADASAHANLGIAYLKKGQPQDALAELNQAAALDKADPRPLEFIGTVHGEAGRWTAAEEALTEAYRRAPGSARVLTALAAAQLRTRGPAAAQNMLARALAADADYPPALYDMGMLNRDAFKNNDEARKYLTRYLKVAGRDAHAETARKILAGPSGKDRPTLPSSSLPAGAPGSRPATAMTNLPSTGIPAGRAATPSNAPTPPKPSARALQTAMEAYNLGVRHQTKRDWGKAIAEYQRALQNNPGMGNAAYNLGLVYRSSGYLPRAKAAFQQALAINPDMLLYRYMLALTLRDLGENADALAELNEVLRANPDHPEAHLLRGLIYSADNANLDPARKEFTRYVELAPQGPSAEQVRNWLKTHP
jgi:tetratricopeptide (TPR) repeat protein